MTDDTAIPGSPDDARWEALGRYLAGELPPHEADVVRAWIADDPAREALVRLMEATPADAPVDVEVDVEAALARVASRIDAPTVLAFRRPAPRTERHRGTGWRVAAAAAAVLAVGGTLWQGMRGPSVGDAHVYATAAGQRDSVTLADGTRVLLGPSSRVEVGATYARGAREVALTGEALFEVVHDAARPFTVRAGALTVRDVGTRFVVRHDAGAAVEVAVTEGVVEATAGDVRARLERGDRGSLSAAGQLTVARAAVADADVAWTRGRLVFADASLDRVRADLRRWYGIELAAGPALASRHVTATFDGDAPAHVLEVLALALGADVARRGDTAVFTPR
jgi:transmembrane sensor